MDANSQRPKGRDGALSSLNVAIEALNLAKEISGITPTKAAFGSISVLLVVIRDSMINEPDYVEPVLSCPDTRTAPNRGASEEKSDDLSQSVCDAINQLTTTVADIQRKVTKRSGRNVASRHAQAKSDKERIAAWKSDLNRILHVFNTELVTNTDATVSDTRQDPGGDQRSSSFGSNQVSSFGYQGIQYLTYKFSVLEESPPAAKGLFWT